LRLLHVIDKPFKVGHERTDDDVSLFLLNEFVVQVEASAKGTDAGDEIEAQADDVEIYLTEVEHDEAQEVEQAERA
jgi:hypothetical protein